MIYQKTDSDYRKMAGLYDVLRVVDRGIKALEGDLFVANNIFVTDDTPSMIGKAERDLREARESRAYLLDLINGEFIGP